MTDQRRDGAIRERLVKCARMLREQNEWLWKVSPLKDGSVSEIEAEHERHVPVCDEPTHYGCNVRQAVEAMEGAAAELSRLSTVEQGLREALLAVTLEEADFAGTVWEGKSDGAVFLSRQTCRAITLSDYRKARAALSRLPAPPEGQPEQEER